MKFGSVMSSNRGKKGSSMQRRFMCSCKNPVLMSATLEFLLHVLLILHVIMEEFVNRPIILLRAVSGVDAVNCVLVTSGLDAWLWK